MPSYLRTSYFRLQTSDFPSFHPRSSANSSTHLAPAWRMSDIRFQSIEDGDLARHVVRARRRGGAPSRPLPETDGRVFSGAAGAARGRPQAVARGAIPSVPPGRFQGRRRLQPRDFTRKPGLKPPARRRIRRSMRPTAVSMTPVAAAAIRAARMAPPTGSATGGGSETTPRWSARAGRRNISPLWGERNARQSPASPASCRRRSVGSPWPAAIARG